MMKSAGGRLTTQECNARVLLSGNFPIAFEIDNDPASSFWRLFRFGPTGTAGEESAPGGVGARQRHGS